MLGAAWLLAAWMLWETAVPSGLDLPELEVRDYFSAAEVDRAEDYERFLFGDWGVSVVASLLVLAIMARRAPQLARRIGIGRVGTGIVLGLVAFTLLWAVSLPLGLAAEWWQRRHGLSSVSYAETVGLYWGSLIAEVLVAAFLIAVVMGLAALLGRWWWLAGVPFLTALIAGLTFVGPVLYPDLQRLEKPALITDASFLARKAGAPGTPVRVEEVSNDTKLANAFAFGIGPTEKVVLWDTLVDGFRRGEVRVVMAHEFGHIARKHLWKGIAWFALFAVPIAVGVTELARRRGGLAHPVSMPFALLVLVVLQVLLAPLTNLVSRRYEAEADWVALQTTRDAASAKGLFRRFGTSNLGDPSPPTWAYLFLDTHPTLIQRIAMAEAWRGRERP